MFPKITSHPFVVTVLCLAISISVQAQDCVHQPLLDKMDEIFETKAVDRLGEVYHTDAVVHNPEGTTTGLTAIIEANKQFLSEVPDAKGENIDVICSGDKMVVRWNGAGTMAGKKIKVTGITIYQIRDGKVAEVWEEMDMMSIMSQLGYEVKPPAGTNN